MGAFGYAAVVFALLIIQSHSYILKRPLSKPSYYFGHLERFKRQSNQTGPDPDICVVRCLRSTEEKLGELQVENADQSGAQSSPLSPQSALSRDYDPKDFQKLCDAYRPGKDCLNQCESTKLKEAALKGMALLHFMCVERYEDFKANLPCMNNASAEAEVKCKPSCTQFETAVNRLEELSSNRDLVINLSQQELTQTLAGSCLYVNCLGKCGNPITEQRCGKKVAELDEDLVKHVFESLRQTVTALGAGDQLPKECLKLSDGGQQ